MKYLENQPDNLLKKLQGKDGNLSHAVPDKTPTLEQQIINDIDFDKIVELCQHLQDAVEEILNSCGLYFRIFSRVKAADSIAGKIQRGKYGTEENPRKIQDLVGLRVVLYYYDDLSICRDIMESTFQMIDEWSRSKYSANEFKATKINGVFRIPTEYFKLYKRELWTLPIDTTFEIQFRTVFFEGWHEIEHDMRYKSLLSDDEFWKGSEELSRMLNCILANLELSDWSLVQLFDQLSYNHYKNSSWELMLKSKFRIRIDEHSPLDSRIADVFHQNRNLAKQFFRAERKGLIRELLKLDNPQVNYNLIVKLLNDSQIHSEEIATICDSVAPAKDERTRQKNKLARLESHLLFHLEQPLLHRETRSLEAEFSNAVNILYRWARFKMNPVFEDMPEEPSSYKNHLPGYQLKITFKPDNYTFSMKLHHIDSKIPGTLWHFHSSIEKLGEEELYFYHITSRDMPRGLSQHDTFLKPSFLSDLSNRVGLTDVIRLGSKAHFVTNSEELQHMQNLIQTEERKLPVIVIVQHSKKAENSAESNHWNYDMNTFTINGTRLAKVTGHYSHVYMVDCQLAKDFSQAFSIPLKVTLGCIIIFWPEASGKSPELFTRNTVINTQFDFNRFAFHDDNIYERAFRHKLVQIIKDDHVSH